MENQEVVATPRRRASRLLSALTIITLLFALAPASASARSVSVGGQCPGQFQNGWNGGPAQAMTWSNNNCSAAYAKVRVNDNGWRWTSSYNWSSGQGVWHKNWNATAMSKSSHAFRLPNGNWGGLTLTCC